MLVEVEKFALGAVLLLGVCISTAAVGKKVCGAETCRDLQQCCGVLNHSSCCLRDSNGNEPTPTPSDSKDFNNLYRYMLIGVVLSVIVLSLTLLLFKWRRSFSRRPLITRTTHGSAPSMLLDTSPGDRYSKRFLTNNRLSLSQYSSSCMKNPALELALANSNQSAAPIDCLS